MYVMHMACRLPECDMYARTCVTHTNDQSVYVHGLHIQSMARLRDVHTYNEYVLLLPQ